MKQAPGILLLFFFSVLSAFANKDARLSYYNYTLNNGLPSNETYIVFQDSKGFIWIGTDHGLARFDGNEFKIFTKENGLTDDGIYGITEDKYGTIWANTFHGGLCKGNEWGFKAVKNNSYILSQHKKNGSWMFTLDKDNDIWLNVHDYCNSLLENNKISEFRFARSFLDTIPPDSIEIYFNNKKEYLFFASNKNDAFDELVAKKFPASNHYIFTLKSIEKLRKDPFTMVHLDSTLLLQDGRTITFLPLDRSKQIKEMKFTKKISFIKRINNKIWIGLIAGGVYQYKLKKDSLIQMEHYFENLTVSNVIKDREGNHWFSTTQSGVFFVPSINFKSITFKDDEFDKQRILCLQSEDDYLYACGNSAGQYKVHKDGTFEVLTTDVKQGDDITSFILENKKLITNTHIAKITQSHPFFDKHNVFNVYFKLISRTPENILIAGYGGAVLMDSSLKMLWATQEIGFREKVESVFTDKDSTTYLGTKGVIYKMKDRRIDTFIINKSIVNSRVKKIAHLQNGLFLLATKGYGILLYDTKANNSFRHINKGLASNIIEDIFIENDSIWWVASYYGISKVQYFVHTNTYTITNLNTKLGLPSNEINSIVKFDNRIWAGTNDGIFWFNENNIGDMHYSAPVFLSRLKVNNKPVNTDSVSVFPYNQNNFEFEFTALSYRSLGKIRYEYKLAGLSDQWFTTEDRNIRFTALKPGDYTLYLRISDPSIYTYSKTISYKFKVTEPYYATFWFILLISVIIIAIIILIVGLWLNNIITKSKSRYKILEAEQQALRSQMNPHFVFNVLNSIQASILENDKRNAVLFLSKFSTLIRRVLNNSKNPSINLKEEIDILKSYLEMEHFRMGDKLNFSIETRLSLEPKEYSIPGFIIQPFIENAIWHGISPSARQGIIEIIFEEKNDQLVCTISDNGVGINFKQKQQKDGKHNSIALKNIQARFDSINTYMKIDTHFNIAETYNSSGEVSGTRVTVIFPLTKEKKA